MDGDYTLKFFDTFGDEFCCGSGNGNYEVKYSSGEVIISGTGSFTDEITIPFPYTLTDGSYKFVGGSATGNPKDWYNPENWNKLAYPLDCYFDDIIIEAECEIDEIILRQSRKLIIRNNAKLVIKE